MAKYEWSEVFTSIEGEGPYSGCPTAYIRFVKCNFTCNGFNNPTGENVSTIQAMGFNPKDYTTLADIPPITRGCDSIYSWDPKFSHFWKKGDETELGQALIETLPHKSFVNPFTGQRVILSLTGGEPTLRAKQIPTLINSPLFQQVNHLLIETNCAVPLQWSFIGALNEWLAVDPARKLTWSNSPKLSVSGEKWEDAIVPSIASMQRMVTGLRDKNQVDQYFKFVCGPTEKDFFEVKTAMHEYHTKGNVPYTTGVYIMPVACVEDQQQEISTAVALKCIETGYVYCHRVHLSTFGNAIGT